MTTKPEQRKKINSSTHEGMDTKTQIKACLASYSQERRDNQDKWLEVGTAIHATLPGPEGLRLWDNWSRESAKYEPGNCAKRWATFKGDKGPGLKDLIRWKEEGVYIRPGAWDSSPSEYMVVQRALGYSFKANEMNAEIYVNGNPMDDFMEAHLLTVLCEHKYKSVGIAQRAWIDEAGANPFHPIRAYLDSLEWNGEDNIGRLGTFIKDRDGIFPMLLRKWLIGAVGKILGPRLGEQNEMLMLEGRQGIGKSRFVMWLGSPLPEFYKAGPIHPENTDHKIDTVGHFVWECDEVGGTMRQAVPEALKSFISLPEVVVRVPYGHKNIRKKVCCSFIGTFNDDGTGILNDTTGNRRFRCCSLESIDFAYDKEDINQLWGQAVALCRKGETHILNKKEEERIQKVNKNFEAEDTRAYWIDKLFTLDAGNENVWLETGEVESILLSNDAPKDGRMDKSIAKILKKRGLRQVVKKVNGISKRVWEGIEVNPMVGGLAPERRN